MAAKPHSGLSGLAMMLPGLVLICFGILVLIYPQVLAWLIGAVLIAMGLGALFMVKAMRNFAARMDSGMVK